MENAIVINGRVTGPRSVELDEPVAGLTGQVEVTLRPRPTGSTGTATTESISDFIRGLPGGTRTREDIDQQIEQERNAWGDRNG